MTYTRPFLALGIGFLMLKMRALSCLLDSGQVRGVCLSVSVLVSWLGLLWAFPHGVQAVPFPMALAHSARLALRAGGTHWSWLMMTMRTCSRAFRIFSSRWMSYVLGFRKGMSSGRPVTSTASGLSRISL